MKSTIKMLTPSMNEKSQDAVITISHFGHGSASLESRHPSPNPEADREVVNLSARITASCRLAHLQVMIEFTAAHLSVFLLMWQKENIIV